MSSAYLQIINRYLEIFEWNVRKTICHHRSNDYFNMSVTLWILKLPQYMLSGKTCRLKFTIFQLLCTENLSLPQSCVSAMICYCWQAVNLGAPSAKRKEAFQLGQLHLQQAARWCFHCSPVCYYSKMQPVCKAFSLIWISFFFILLPSASSNILFILCHFDHKRWI